MIRFLLSFTVFISFSYTVFSKEYYELRTYKLNSPEKAAAFDKMMAAAVPLLATTELKSIGVLVVSQFYRDVFFLLCFGYQLFLL